ncbi:MAG: nicotinamide-nucleotide adenylyltransferase [Candidatus Heimdallarchaeaceae archaeon]
MRALYLGRFNPPHLGHIEAIKYILEQPDIDEIIILIGSGEKAYYLKNPFTGGERVEMMTAIARTYFNINQFYIMAIPDSNRNSIWPAHAIDLVPPFEVVFTNNPLVQELFGNLTTKEVREMPLVKRKELSGKEIRRRIINGEEWKELVPPIIYQLIEKYNGVERLQKIAQDDY